MTMSMFSSITPDEFNQEEDLYGKQILKLEAYTKGVQMFVFISNDSTHGPELKLILPV